MQTNSFDRPPVHPPYYTITSQVQVFAFQLECKQRLASLDKEGDTFGKMTHVHADNHREGEPCKLNSQEHRLTSTTKTEGMSKSTYK